MDDQQIREEEGAALNRLLAERGIVKKKFAKEHNLPGGASMLSQHLSGHRPINLEHARVYSKGMGIGVGAFSPRLAREIADLLGTIPLHGPVAEPAASYVSQPKGIRVPLLANGGSMGNGDDELHDDVMVGQIVLSPDWVARRVRPTATSALRFIHAYGDSMHPTLNDGDVLLVDTGVRDPSIDGVYVLRANGRVYIKRVRQRMDGRYEVSSDNPTVKTVDVLDGSQPIDVAGRVIWAWNGANL